MTQIYFSVFYLGNNYVIQHHQVSTVCDGFIDLLVFYLTGSSVAVRMQSTANYLWLISDLLGQGATANVYRGRHKVSTMAPNITHIPVERECT